MKLKYVILSSAVSFFISVVSAAFEFHILFSILNKEEFSR